MIVYIYESHEGGLYVEDRELTFEELYCDQCGDNDRLVFKADNIEDVRKYLRSKVIFCDEGEYPVEDCEDVYYTCKWMFEDR